MDREGIVLYPAGGRPLVPPQRVRERPHEPPPSVYEWIDHAAIDLLVITNNLAGKKIPWPAICSYAQQAGEKYLRVVIAYRWARPAHTHDLTVLLHSAREACHALPGLDADCALLTTYAVTPRYPDDPPAPKPRRRLGEMEGRDAVAAMHRIVAATNACMGIVVVDDAPDEE